MPDTEDKDPSMDVNTKSQVDKVMRLEEKIMAGESSNKNQISSTNRQFVIRRSVDSPTNKVCYEVIPQDNISDSHLETSINSRSVPSVKMQRLETALSTPAVTKSAGGIENGLVPMELALISSTSCSTFMPSDGIEDEEEEVVEEEIMDIEKDEIEEDELADSILVESREVPTTKIQTSTPAIASSNSVIATLMELTPPSKMNREMRNLQKSTNESKVLSDFLTVTDTPRNRSRKAKDTTSVLSNENNDSNDTNSTTRMYSDKEVPLKDSGNDSDSTVVMNDESSTKQRRKSVSRSRSKSRLLSRARSVSSRNRKSISEMDDTTIGSEKDERNNEEEEEIDEDLGEAPYIAKLIENKAPNPPPRVGCDSFCFKCHADNAVLSLACKRCKCSYHRHCARLLATPIPKNPDDFVCIDCIEIDKANQSSVNKYNHPKIEPHMLKEMLITILEKIRTYPDRDFFENDIQFKSAPKDTNQPLIITQMSLKRIEEKVINIYYKVSEAFLHDIKQLEHNWTIIDRNKLKSLKLILKFVNTEINEMEACVHCFSNSFVVSNWFTAPCKRPHLLIWAKLKGYPYWPAKVMSIDSAKENADVRFFGAHDRAWVPVSHCLIFGDKDPNKSGKNTTPTNNKSKSQKGIADAIKEKDEYIQNMKERYGFRYATAREILDPNNLQKQLENQLPGLKKDSNEKSDLDKNQKEKLTLKIIKTSDGTQTIEKTPKVSDKDRHPLYRVLSKNEENAESNEQSRVVKAIILKRNTEADSNKSDTSDSVVSGSATSHRRKSLSVKEGTKRRKSTKNVERSSSPEPPRKKPRDDNSNLLLKALSLQPNQKNADAPVKISTSKQQKVPPGTNEIYSLKDSKPTQSRTAQRSQSFNRSNSIDEKKKDKTRRLSTLSSPSSLNHEKLLPIENTKAPVSPSPAKAGKSSTNAKTATPTSSKNNSRTPTPMSVASTSNNKSNSKRPSINDDFNPEIVIKDEPVSDEEEIVQRNRVTVSDLAGLVGEIHSAKRKTILISTSDNSNDSHSFQNQVSRARKSFPNSIQIPRASPDSLRQLQGGSNRNSTSNAMVCIPQVFPTVVSLNTTPSPSSASQGASNINNGTDVLRRISSSSNPAQLQLSNGSEQMKEPSADLQVNSLPKRLHQRLVSTNSESSGIGLPRLVPKPAGIFTSDGSTFQRESGDVAALFSQNAHRMTDYFKSLLVDTISAISNGVPDAQIVMLKLEVEKLKQHILTLKKDHQMSIERIRKEHDDELKVLKTSYDDKIKSIQNAHHEDNVRLIKEIRQQCEIEKQRAIEATRRETKKMTWCSVCTKEARFYCCWNTSYCGTACQKSHWQQHLKYCTNRNSNNTSDLNAHSSNNNKPQQQQPQPPQQQPQPMQVEPAISQIQVTGPQPPQSQSANQTAASVKLANLAANNTRQIMQHVVIPKQMMPHHISQQPQPPTSLASMIHIDNSLIRNKPPPAIITTTRGQQIIQTTLLPPQYLIQQQKITSIPVPPLVPTDQNAGSSGNVYIRSVPRNANSPQKTIISSSGNPNFSELVSSSGQSTQSGKVFNVISSSNTIG